MFEGCKKLVGDITYSVYRTDESYAKVDGGYFSDKVYTRPWAKLADGTLTFLYGYKKTFYDQADQQPKVFFDLMGRKVSVPQKGQIYILDGKKVAHQ